MKPLLACALSRLLIALASGLPLLAQAASEAPKCVYASIAKLPLRYTGPDLMITTGGSINGTPAELLVDTGAYQTFFTRTGTERRGMHLSNTGRIAYGLGGITSIYETRISEFSAGPARMSKGSVPVLTDFGFTPSFDGILGSPFLLQSDLEVSLASKEMTFYYAKNCANTYLGYWGDDVIAIPFKPHDHAGLNPHFLVHVNGQEMEAMIDTGAATSSIQRDAAKRAGVEVDTPGVTRSHDSVGAGDRKVASWVASIDTFRIGDETVRKAELAIIDVDNHGVDVILGADFLRAHRVLFAMSQKKLYFSYVGGAPFGQRSKLEPWIRAEADGGNPDAQMALASAYKEGKLVPRDEAQAAAWLDKAASGGSPHANLAVGRDLIVRRDYAAAVPRLRGALDQLPAERKGALLLYIARVRSGQAELAKTELAATFARSERGEWPKPVAEFYLGMLTADKLLAQAADDRQAGKQRRCSALSAMGDWHRAHDQAAQAKALDEQIAAGCGDTGQTFTNLGD